MLFSRLLIVYVARYLKSVRPEHVFFFLIVDTVDNVDASVVVTRTRIIRKNNIFEKIDAIICVGMCERSVSLYLECVSTQRTHRPQENKNNEKHAKNRDDSGILRRVVGHNEKEITPGGDTDFYISL